MFSFWFRQLRVFPVWSQFCCACQGEKSSTIFSGNTVEAVHIFSVVFMFEHVLNIRSSSFFRSSSYFRSSSFFRLSAFFGRLHFLRSSSFFRSSSFWGLLPFEVLFSIYSMSRPNLLFTASKSDLKHLR